MGRLRASAIARDPRTRLVAVFDADPSSARSLATDHGATATTSAEAAVEAADAVFVCTTADESRGVRHRCGRPPASDLLREAPGRRRRLGERGQRARSMRPAYPAMIGFSKRFDPGRRALEDAVRRGEIGTVELVLLTNRDPNTTSLRPLIDFLRAMHDTAPYGLIRESTVHDFDTARALLGEEPTELYAIGSNLASDEMAGSASPTPCR